MCHIDWNWIKQRPQFIAEGLSSFFDVSVVYMFQNRNRTVLQKGKEPTVPVNPIYAIPFFSRLSLTRYIDEKFRYFQYFRHYKRIKPDYLYFTHPYQNPVIPKRFKGKIVYDCMDNYVAMARDSQKEIIKNYEQKLVDRADSILVSSQKLEEVLVERYGEHLKEKISIVRNGYSGNILPVAVGNESRAENKFTISYIGTIGAWFNFDYVLRSLQEFPNLEYRIIGPSDSPSLPQADRLVYVGTVEHSKLHEEIQDVQCLVMPFQMNDIVEAVDPVKLYEYINFNKNILCVKYKEIERFDPFVHFYTDYESFRNQISRMMEDNTLRYSQESRRIFLEENSWESRVSQIKQILEEA